MNADTDRHPLYALVPDPAGLPPVCDAERFAEILTDLVAAEAPQVFAVVEEYGDRVAAQIAAWGLSFQDRTHVIDVEGGMHIGMPSPQSALLAFGIGTRIKPHLVWLHPDQHTHPSRLATSRPPYVGAFGASVH
jgi:hypothetical protein